MDVTADQAAGDAAATLDAVATAYWDAYLEANPEFATAIGDARFDDILEDPTPEGAAATRARYTDVLARASRIDPDALDADGRITLAALRESAGSDIAQIDTRPRRLEPRPARGRARELPADPRLPAPRDRRGRPPDARPLARDGDVHGPAPRQRPRGASPTAASRASRPACGRSGSSRSCSTATPRTGRCSRRSTTSRTSTTRPAGRSRTVSASPPSWPRWSMARSGRRSSGCTTRSSPRSCRTPARRASRASATSPAASTPTGS